MAQHPMGQDDDEAALLRKASLGEVEPPPDFLAGVQAKLHARSGGKFYRSRWSRSRLATTTQIISLLMLLVIVLIWLFASPVKDLGPDREIKIQTPAPPP